jgi:hypothetical protein
LIAIIAAAALAVGALAWATSGSESSLSPGPGQSEVGGDAAVKSGVDAIARACSQFAGANGYGPSTDDVAPYGAVAEFVRSWPTNPYTGEPMSQGAAPGDFSFNTAIRMPGGEYVGYVTGHLGDGQTYSVEFKY